MKQKYLSNSIVYFFILLFLYTGIDKLMEIKTFREQMASSPIFESVSGGITWAIPLAEITVAVILFIPAFRLKGLYITLVLMSVFTIYLLAILAMDSHLSCSCGGIISQLSPRQHLLFNSFCILLSGAGILGFKKQALPIRFRRFTTIGTGLIFLSIGYIVLTAAITPVKLKTPLKGRLLPSFTFLMTDSLTTLNTNAIPTGKPIIMIGFSPFCRHCQEEISDITKHIEQFKSTQIYLITPFPYKDLKTFYAVFNLAKYQNITACWDNKNDFMAYLKLSTVPFAAIYDSQKRLKEVITGRADNNLITKSITE